MYEQHVRDVEMGVLYFWGNAWFRYNYLYERLVSLLAAQHDQP